MTTAYFDCSSGISGDMILGTLIDLGVPVLLLDEAIRSLGVDGVRLETQSVHRKGFRATSVKVVAPHEHVHRHLSTIVGMIDRSNLSDANKHRASEIFRRIAAAEAKVHGVDIEEVHFHEVGAIDSIADIVGAVVGLDYLGIDKVLASPVPTGCGTVKIAHGICSVPAPATAELLKGIPIAASDVPFELTTPTGAAVLAFYAESFGALPSLTIQAIGLGAGTRDLEQQPNILRLVIGKINHEHSPTPQTAWLVETNLDDISGEIIGYCIERLWSLDPLDVWTTAVSMKKQRPGVVLSVLCRWDQLEAVEGVLFTETTTLGVRRWPVERTVLHREVCELSTPWGPVAAKRAVLPDGTEKTAPEYEAVRKIAEEHHISLREVFQALR